MVEDWQAENLQKRTNSEALRFFCARCSTLRASDDARCGECGQDRPAAGWAGLEQAFDPFLGRVLQERYLIDKIEGRGSSATVYRAKSLTLPRRFAIKMVRLGYSDRAVAEQAQARLEREVLAVGMLRSPHIIRVYEMFEIDPQWVAVVMEHVDGETVEERVAARGAMELDEACRLLLQVANGLCEAHQNGMVHRDIKPANLMLEQLPDGRDFAYLLDFGVVQLRGETGMTQGFLGTPLFASPEQASARIIDPMQAQRGEAEATIDARSDIYSLGATFYYMLTGRAPFEHSDTVKLLQAHLQRTAPTLAKGRPGHSFPASIEALVASMLAKSRDDRPANIFRVIDALQAYEAEADSPISEEMNPVSELEPNTVAIEDAPPQDALRHDKHEDSKQEAPLPDRTSFKNATFENATFENVASRRRYDSSDLLEKSSSSESRPHSILPEGRPRRQTKPGAQMRPRTNPRAPSSTTLERLVHRTANGHPFARNIRATGVDSAGHIGFVDSHNEVWTLQEPHLTPRCTPHSRVCALSTSERDVFVGLQDGSIHRVRRRSRDLEQLFPTTHAAAGAAINALSTTPTGELLLAASVAGTLFIGRRASGDASSTFAWQAQQAPSGIAALTLSPDGQLLAAASDDHRVRLSVPDAPDIALAQFDTGSRVIDMTFSTDGALLAVLLKGVDDTRADIQVYQVLGARKISAFTLSTPLPRNLFFSAHNMLHGVCAAHGRIGSWNMMST